MPHLSRRLGWSGRPLIANLSPKWARAIGIWFCRRTTLRTLAGLLCIVVASSMPVRADQAVETQGSSTPIPASPSPLRGPATGERSAWLSPGGVGSRAGGSDFRLIVTAGLALVLAICGGLGVVARRYLPKGVVGSMKVIGRVGLTPKHAVYMVQVGRRVLVIGTGPQGAPSLISELDDFELPLVLSGSPAVASGRRDEA
jgi:flagellar protein FliO/FliZ